MLEVLPWWALLIGAVAFADLGRAVGAVIKNNIKKGAEYERRGEKAKSVLVLADTMLLLLTRVGYLVISMYLLVLLILRIW